MVNYKILMKPLSLTEPWQDVTHAVFGGKDIKLRKGFASLSKSIDVGSVSLSLHMESLDAAALLHTSRKQVLIHADGAPIFEGVSFDDSDIDLDMNTDYVYASLKFKPYSSLFEQAKVPSDTVLTDVKICDPADAEHSLVHILFGMIVENMPDPLPAIISPSFGITTSVNNTKVLPLVILEKGESLEDILTSVLYQNGYTYYMEQFSVILIEPYASGREPTSQVPITSILAKPSISQAPYVVEEKCVVRFPRVEQYTDETVYELNGDRIEGTAEPTQVQVLEPADYYPTDEDEPATLEADYESVRETDDIELVHVVNPVLDVHTRALLDAGAGTTQRVHITIGTHDLGPTGARIQLYNNLAEDVSLRNIRVIAGTAYYRNWSVLYEDDDTTATDTDETDGLYMPDAESARAFIARYRSEISAEKTSVEFTTHLDFTPGDLIELGGLPYWLLVRSVTDRRDESELKDYSCVAYRVHTIATNTRIRVRGNTKASDGNSPVPVRLYAIGDEDGPYEDSVVLADDYMIASDDGLIVGVSEAWQLIRPTPGEGEYVWRREGYYTPPETWPKVWEVTRVTGANGADARVITLTASQSVINVSSRGELKTQQIEITCLPSNLPISDAVWTATDEGSLSQIEIAEGVFDQYRRILDCSLVTGDSTLISVSIVFYGVTYSGVIGITKVADGTPSPLYLDAQSSVPTLTTEGPLIVGDFFLYVGAYSGPNSDPGDQGLNPPALEINEFVYGRIYEYRGKDALDVDQWQESRKSEHLAAAQKDALQIAKDSNTYMFVAVLVAQLGLFFDLIVAGVLKSPNYAENASGVPTAGFKLDGLKGLIKALGLEAYEAMIYGNLQASGFKTLQEEPGTTIATASVTPTLWKHSEMEALIASQDSLATLSGTIDGYSFNKATRRLNQRVLLASHGYESESISAGESHLFTVLTPSQVFSPNSFYCEYSGYYKGNFSFRYYYILLDWSGYRADELGTSYTVAKNYSIPWPRDGQPHSVTLFVRHYSAALFDFGAKPSHVDYHRVWTSEIFSGLVLVNGELSYKVISPKPTAYYTTAKTWTIGSYNQNSIANYCSGTAFYNLFSSLAIGTDGFCDGGQINVNGTLYTVTRLTKAANSITFYTSGGVITVNKFQEGTNVGVYTELAVTQAINFQAVVGGIEVKHIFPWGTQAGSPGNYDLGTSDARFNTLWLKILDVLNVVRFRSTLQVDGVASVASINTGGLGAFLIGQNLRTTDSPTFAAITAGTINTGYGANEVFKISNQKLTITYDEVNMAAMDVGEIRFVSASIRGDDSDGGILKTPSGGSYIVVGYGGAEAENYIRSYTPGNTPIADVYNDSTKYFNGIVRRVS